MTARLPILRRRSVRLATCLASLLLVAGSAGVQDLLARDGGAQFDVRPGSFLVENATWSAAVEGTSVECANGFAGPFPCENVDLAALVLPAEIGVPTGSDVWGWTDPEDGREIAITTTLAGAAFVDVTEPTAPVVLGRMLIGQDDDNVIWRDVKVHNDHAYVVSEHGGTHMHIFDLTRLRDVAVDQGFLDPDAIYTDFGSSHNIAINEDTGFAYAIGSDTCEGGLHMIDLGDPKAPTFAGCFDEDGYTHDVQCVIYHGPDEQYQGHEICFASNEDTITIVDVTDKDNPVMIARSGYDSAAYTHQGWLTPDHRWFIFGDELDEATLTVPATATYIVNVEDLDQPGEIKTFLHDTLSIDHNIYVDSQYVWQGNYMAGLRILSYDEAGLEAGELTEVGFFDVFPTSDAPQFAGAWTAYPFFESGTVVLSSFDSGLFVLRPTVARAVDPPQPDPAPQPEPADEDDDAGLPATGGGAAGLGLAGFLAALVARRRQRAAAVG